MSQRVLFVASHSEFLLRNSFPRNLAIPKSDTSPSFLKVGRTHDAHSSGKGAIRPFHVVRIHVASIPGSRNSRASLCPGELRPSNIRIDSSRTPESSDSYVANQACDLPYSVKRLSALQVVVQPARAGDDGVYAFPSGSAVCACISGRLAAWMPAACIIWLYEALLYVCL